MDDSNIVKPPNPGSARFDPQKQAELEAALKQQRDRRTIFGLVILCAVILAIAAGYFFAYKPYADSVKRATVHVKESESLVSQGRYDMAIQSLSRARIEAPHMKALYYRAGIIYMNKKMQMEPQDYANAEEMFKMEINHNGHVAGAEMALGFLYAIDGLIQDDEIPVDSKASIIMEISNALDLNITIKPELTSLGLSKSTGYQAAIEHFNKAYIARNDFEPLASTGLAYAHALKGSRDDGKDYFARIERFKDRFPVLVRFYESSAPRLGVTSDDTARIFSQAQLLAFESRYDEALRLLEDARIANPDLDGIYYYSGLINLLKMDFDEASILFQKEHEKDSYASRSDVALGFIYLVDSILSERTIPADAKRSIIEEMSSSLGIDIALRATMEGLNLGSGSSTDKAISHFQKAAERTQSFSNEGSKGLAYAYALQMNREDGDRFYRELPSKTDIPILKEYYDNHQPSLTIAADVVSIPKPPSLPVDELPPTSHELFIPDLPDLDMPQRRDVPPWKEPRNFVIEPTVKPFKLSEHLGRDGRTSYIVTLLNVKESGRTIAREGQTRKMPKTDVEVTVVRITEDRIVLNEDNLYRFTWERTQNTWHLTEKEQI